MEKKFLRGSIVVNKGAEEFKCKIVVLVTGDRSKRDDHFSGVCISTYNPRVNPIGDFSDTWHLNKFEKLFDSFEEWLMANQITGLNEINSMENNTQLPVEVVEQIENDSIERFPVTLTHGNHVRPILIQRAAYVTGATAYATKLHKVEQENAQLRRWKMEAAELLTKIHSYAHKHLEIKLGESTVDFVIAMAKERDDLKRQNDKLKQQAAGWVKGAPKEGKQHFAKVPSAFDDDVFYDAIIWPIDGSDHWWCVGEGFKFTTHKDNIIAHIDEKPAAGREEDGVVFAEWIEKNAIAQYSNKKHSGWRLLDIPYSENTDYTTAELYELFKQQKENP